VLLENEFKDFVIVQHFSTKLFIEFTSVTVFGFSPADNSNVQTIGNDQITIELCEVERPFVARDPATTLKMN